MKTVKYCLATLALSILLGAIGMAFAAPHWEVFGLEPFGVYYSFLCGFLSMMIVRGKYP